jgi:hypothetical protein
VGVDSDRLRSNNGVELGSVGNESAGCGRSIDVDGLVSNNSVELGACDDLLGGGLEDINVLNRLSDDSLEGDEVLCRGGREVARSDGDTARLYAGTGASRGTGSNTRLDNNGSGARRGGSAA